MNVSQLKDLDRLIAEIKECALGLVNEIDREQMAEAMAKFIRLNRALAKDF